MNEFNDEKFQAILDYALKFIQGLLSFLASLQNLAVKIKNDPSAIKLANTLLYCYEQLPETVTLALTASIVFASTFMVLRLGRSMLSFLMLLLQLVFVVGLGLIGYVFRDQVWDFLDWMLK